MQEALRAMKILISPFSRKLAVKNPKSYPYWNEVVAGLKAEGHATIQLGLGGEEELATDRKLFNLTLLELREALADCDLWMSVDNFWPHFVKCWAPGKRGVVLFSRSDPEIFGYPTNLNLLKSREYLCRDQWRFWHDQEYLPDAFVEPEKVLEAVRRLTVSIGNACEISVIIPTHNNGQRLLKPALESIVRNTDLKSGRVEIIVVADGCTDDTVAICAQFGAPVRLVTNTKQLGYTRSCNIGSKEAQGEFLLQLNDDIELLTGWPQDTWLNLLVNPFKRDSLVGATGAYKKWCPHARQPFLLGFCLCVRREVWESLGGYDEAFSPGYGEDTDLCVRIKQRGLRIVQVAHPHPVLGITTGELPTSFPIWHKGSQSIRSLPEWENVVVKRNSERLAARYSDGLKLDLGCGLKAQPGFVGVDLYRDEADLKIDAQSMPMIEAKAVAVLQAVHLLEYLNPLGLDKTLAEWLRVLKPGGQLFLEVLNLEHCCRDFVNANESERAALLQCFFGAVSSEPPKLSGYYPDQLAKRLRQAGFEDVVEKPAQESTEKRAFRMEAKKSMDTAALWQV